MAGPETFDGITIELRPVLREPIQYPFARSVLMACRAVYARMDIKRGTTKEEVSEREERRGREYE